MLHSNEVNREKTIKTAAKETAPMIAGGFKLPGELVVFRGSQPCVGDVFFEVGSQVVGFLLLCSGLLFGAHASLPQPGVMPSRAASFSIQVAASVAWLMVW